LSKKLALIVGDQDPMTSSKKT